MEEPRIVVSELQFWALDRMTKELKVASHRHQRLLRSLEAVIRTELSRSSDAHYTVAVALLMDSVPAMLDSSRAQIYMKYYEVIERLANWLARQPGERRRTADEYQRLFLDVIVDHQADYLRARERHTQPES